MIPCCIAGERDPARISVSETAEVLKKSIFNKAIMWDRVERRLRWTDTEPFRGARLELNDTVLIEGHGLSCRAWSVRNGTPFWAGELEDCGNLSGISFDSS